MPLQLAVETTGAVAFDDRPAVDARPAVDDRRTLARIEFGSAHRIDTDPRRITIGQPVFLDRSPVEVWQSEKNVETGRHGEIAFASDGRFLFGHVHLAETPGSSLETLAHHAYTTILKSLDDFGDLHLLRIWNIIDAINETQAGLERYRSFCIGRSRAFADRGFADRALPAASGVGAEAPGLMISFIAATDPGLQVENPRQVSAFRYPPQHGPRSPSFSRALTYKLTEDRHILFISGTASIVGHETVHPESLDKQFEETCRNFDAVMGAVGAPCDLEALRVYIRHEDDAPAVIEASRKHFGDKLPIIPLKSAICRNELLVEIEGVATVRASTDATMNA